MKPRYAVLADPSTRERIGGNAFPHETEAWFGPEAVERIASHPDIDTVVCGIVGAAGLRGRWAAIESGNRVGIANKGTLVVAGPLVMQLAAKTGSILLPVDSEHSAVFQALTVGTTSRFETDRADGQRRAVSWMVAASNCNVK